jgi:UDP-N-acetyl-D-galactosamine dehydrogenase
VVDIIGELADYGVKVDVFDPWIDPSEARHEYGLDLVATPDPGAYHGIVVAVAHRQFAELGSGQIRAYGRAGAVVFDVKAMLPKDESDLRL